MGDYSTEDLSAAVQGNAIQALAALYGLAGLTRNNLRLHKEDPNTTHRDCPGTNIVKNDVIALVTACLSDKFTGEHVPCYLSKMLYSWTLLFPRFQQTILGDDAYCSSTVRRN